MCNHNYSDTVFSYTQSQSLYFPQVNRGTTVGFKTSARFWLGRAEITLFAICSKLFKASIFVFSLPNSMQKELK